MIETIPSLSGATDFHVQGGNPSPRHTVPILNSDRAHLTPFSERAAEVLGQKVNDYSDRLQTQAIEMSKRHQADQVSASDVERAAECLISSVRSKRYRFMSAAGALLFSIGGSGTLTIMTTSQFSNSGIVVTFLLTIAGTALLAVSFVKD